MVVTVRDLTNPNWIKTKGILFLALGMLSGGLVFFDHPTVKIGLLLVISVWSFCRFYYFAFYVIGQYVDPSHRFTGLLSFVQYFVGRRSTDSQQRN